MSKQMVQEPARDIEVIESADVVVLGGGPGGIPAAVAASRAGAKTVLIERYGVLGGLATTCLMGPLFGYAPFGYFDYHQAGSKYLLGGIPVEIVRKLQEIGGAPDDDAIDWQSVKFDPELFKFVADDLVKDSGAILFLHAYTVNTVVEDTNIKAVIIESKSGRQAVTGKVFIDATGDGDVAFFSGCSYTKGRQADGVTLAVGSRFRIGGLRPRTPEEKQKCIELSKEVIADDSVHMLSASDFEECGSSVRQNESTPDITRRMGDGTKMKDLTRCELQIRKDTMKIMNFLKEKVPGFESSYLMDTPFGVGVRETRQIAGKYTLTTDDVANVRKFPETTVARGCWFFDMHCPLGRCFPGNDFTSAVCTKRCKMAPNCIMKTKYEDQLLDDPYLPKGEYYDIPYGCLVADDIDNLLISGRCVSASHEAMSSLRVIATCFAIGEAAGVAGAMSADQNIRPEQVNVAALQNQLRAQGVPL